MRLCRLFLFLTSCTAATTLEAKPAPAPSRAVVLVHGFMNTGAHFKLMQQRLEKSGYTCYSPTLTPWDGRGGLENLAAQLKQDIDAHYKPDQKITLIGFSMGGIISRYYLQELEGAARCETFITISSPHHGTRTAWLYPTKGAEQMRPGSELLKYLTATENRLGNIKVISYRTPLDLMIFPAQSSVWDRAENVSFPVAAHPLMLLSNTVISDIEKRLKER